MGERERERERDCDIGSKRETDIREKLYQGYRCGEIEIDRQRDRWKGSTDLTGISATEW